MRIPSIKTLQPIFGERAKEARELLQGTRKTKAYQSVQDWMRQCYHEPIYQDRLMVALNEIAGTYGVESFETHKNNRYDYLNAGDPYSATLIYSHTTNTVRVSAWGDIVEREGAD